MLRAKIQQEMKSVLTLALMMMLCNGLLAQTTNTEKSNPSAEAAISLEFDGLVLDQTRSRIGREFYEQLYAKWTAAEMSTGGFDILIEELPARGRLGFLQIKVKDAVVAAYHLQPGGEWMENAVQEATGRLSNYFQNLEQVQRALESKDQVGSGIY